MKTAPLPWDLTRIMLAVVAIGGLIAATFWVVRPFLPAVIWATMIVVATWPMMRGVEARLGDRRSLAVAVMTLVMLVILVVPIAVAIVTLVEHTDAITGWVRTVTSRGVPAPPEWLRSLPLVGERLATEWQKIAMASREELAARVTPYLGDIVRWIISQAGGIGVLFIHLLLTVAVAAILYARGEEAAAGVLAFATRLAGEQGRRAAVLSAQAIRAVAMGIVVTALLQSVIGGIGLAITGVPYPGLLTAVMFLLGVAQIGAGPVLVGAVIWLYWQDGVFWGTVMLVWSVVTGSLDNFVRPVLIRRGADLPLLLIFAGVLGGLLAFGIIGLFVGPVLLAVTYTLLVAWVSAGDGPAE
jgi:predicted PurR-regulated permease PerM